MVRIVAALFYVIFWMFWDVPKKTNNKQTTNSSLNRMFAGSWKSWKVRIAESAAASGLASFGKDRIGFAMSGNRKQISWQSKCPLIV